MSVPKNMVPDEITLALAIELLSLPKTLGTHPESGQPIRASIGRYGPYVQHGKSFASLKASDDIFSIELEREVREEFKEMEEELESEISEDLEDRVREELKERAGEIRAELAPEVREEFWEREEQLKELESEKDEE